VIPDEAVEAAARGLAVQKWPTAIGVWDSFGQGMKNDFRDQARAALEAAAPHLFTANKEAEDRLLALAWSAGVEAVRANPTGQLENPYKKDPK